MVFEVLETGQIVSVVSALTTPGSRIADLARQSRNKGLRLLTSSLLVPEIGGVTRQQGDH